jgi:hypothetical protein
MQTHMSVYRCRVTFKKHSNDSPTLSQHQPQHSPNDCQPSGHLLASIGTLLFYARAIDNTMHVALGTMAAAQTQGTVHTMDMAIQLLNYATAHPEAAVRFHKNDMRLCIHSDASCLSEPRARSRVGG